MKSADVLVEPVGVGGAVDVGDESAFAAAAAAAAAAYSAADTDVVARAGAALCVADVAVTVAIYPHRALH